MHTHRSRFTSESVASGDLPGPARLLSHLLLKLDPPLVEALHRHNSTTILSLRYGAAYTDLNCSLHHNHHSQLGLELYTTLYGLLLQH